MSYTNAIFYLDPTLGSDAARTALTTVTVANPSGTITRCTKVGHGLVTGAVVTLSLFTAWLNDTWKITVFDNDNFDLDGAIWQATADANGTVTPFGGMNWADAWKTISAGPTTARIAPGDTIRIAKSLAPVSTGVNGVFTDDSATVTLSAPLTKTIETCEANWTASANVTPGNSTTCMQGTKSITLAFGVNFTTGLAGYKDLVAPIDLSAFTKITLWIKSSSLLAGGIFQILLDDSAGCGTPLESLTINSQIRGNFTAIVLTLANPAALTAVASVGISCLSDPGTPTISIDNIEACNDFNLKSIIGKNTAGEGWWPIRSIVEGTISLGTLTYPNKYQGVSETAVPLYMRNDFFENPTYGTAMGAVQDSGTLVAPITFSGGWNKATTQLDGDTWFSGVTEENNGIDMSGRAYINVDHLYFVKYNYAIYLTGDFANFSNAGGCGCVNGITAQGIATEAVFSNIILTSCYNECGVFSGVNTVLVKMDTCKFGSVGASAASVLNFASTTALLAKDIKVWGSRNVWSLYCQGSVLASGVDVKNSGGLIGMTISGSGMKYFHNFVCPDATPISVSNVLVDRLAYYTLQKYQGVEGDNRAVYKYGEVRRNTADARTTACAQMIPNTIGKKLELPLFPIAALANVQCVVTAYIKKDGSYGSVNPRIGLRVNGFLTAAMAECVVSTSYQQFTVSYQPTVDCILELVVDCEGTAGNIYVDDIGFSGVTQPVDNWGFGEPYLSQIASAAAGGGKLIDGGLLG